MKIEKIRPIPKYIIKKIETLDKKTYPEQSGYLRFYSYLTFIKKELVRITVAVRNRYKNWYCKQVAVHGLNYDKCYVKDMEYCGYVGMGYRVGWFEQGLNSYRKFFENEKWGCADDMYYNPFAPVVNLKVVDKFSEFKYSAYYLYRGDNILKYLRLYRKYPQTEYLLKMGLHCLVESIIILKRIGKDKQFCKWLIANRDRLITYHYYVSTIMKAYTSKKDIDYLQKLEYRKKCFARDSSVSQLRKLFKGKNLEQFFSYLDKQQATANSYLDYIKACQYLNLDITQEKHLFPKNFKRWHDIRIDEYNTAKALASEKQRAEMYKQFELVAEKYMNLEHHKQNSFMAIIAKSPDDLIREGEILHHCVGKMNYDQKMLREETLIFFIRSKEAPDIPFVTVEFSLKSKKVLQCYGLDSKAPDESVTHYVNKVWLPYVSRTIKRLAKVA